MNWWQNIIRVVENFLVNIHPSPTITPVEPEETAQIPQSAPEAIITPSPLTVFCGALEDFEGGPTDANHINNNPGNARYNPSGYLPEYGHVKESPDGFAVFPSMAQGWLYLENLVKEKATNHPTWTFLEFFSNWAPASDGNNPLLYSQFIAKRCQVDISTIVKQYLQL